MISTILHKMSVAFLASEENRASFVKYENMRKEAGWKVYQSLIVSLANAISNYMLSADFTRLDKAEKDAQQRAFFCFKELMDFLLDPLKGANKYAAIKRHNKKMGATDHGDKRRTIAEMEATAGGFKK